MYDDGEMMARGAKW